MEDINLTDRCVSMDETTQKAQRLNKQLKEARTLADELASMLDGLEIDIESGKRKTNEMKFCVGRKHWDGTQGKWVHQSSNPSTESSEP